MAPGVEAAVLGNGPDWWQEQGQGQIGEDREAFNEVIHSPIRLQVCAILAGAESLSFADVQATLGITDSHLSKNVRVLADAGLVSPSKQHGQATDRQRPVTVLALTTEGQRVYRQHAAWLAQITHNNTPPSADAR